MNEKPFWWQTTAVNPSKALEPSAVRSLQVASEDARECTWRCLRAKIRSPPPRSHGLAPSEWWPCLWLERGSQKA
eukprot:306828-Pyramimonas_sp.AAC.1